MIKRVFADIGSRRTGEEPPPTLQQSTSTPWLPSLATVLCAGHDSAFVADLAICRQVGRLNWFDRMGDREGQGTNTVLGTVWTLTSPRDMSDVAPFPYERSLWTETEALAVSAAYAGPPVTGLALRGRRELNGASADEISLAEAIHQRQLDVPIRAVLTRVGYEWRDATLASHWASAQALDDDLTSMSSNYRADVFGVEQPAEPVSTASLLLASIVILPELVVVGALGARRGPWAPGRDFVALAILSAVGSLSLGGLVALTVQEQAGSVWRATCVRRGLTFNFPPSNQVILTNLSGTQVREQETLLIISRPGYRPRLLVGVTIAAAAMYVVTVGTVLALGVRSSRRAAKRKAIDNAVEDTNSGNGGTWG